MAIGQAGMFYDANRDMYVGSDYYRDQEREYRRHQEEMIRKQQMLAQQQMGHNPYVISASGTGATVGTLQFVGDAKDPLAFLQKTDNKILLTGETQ